MDAFMVIVGFILFVALVIFIRLKMPMWKGKYSEKLVYNKISELSDEYFIFNDLLFESNGRSTQIDHIVVNRYDLTWAISQYKTPVLDKATIEWIIQTIQQNHIVANKEDLKQHKYNAKSQQYKSRNLISKGVCPRCGGQLILRQGKYGSFYGCSNYPKCKFTHNS